MVDFGGWEMPLSYPLGTLREHLSCRSGSVVFDVSHLGTVEVKGIDAFDLLQRHLSNDLGKITPGRAQYTHLLDGQDASVLDDIIVWWDNDQRFLVMPNASNTERVRERIGGDDTTETRSILALQGPKTRDVLAKVIPESAGVGRFRVGHYNFEGVEILVAGTGYTGEDGVEISIENEASVKLFSRLLEEGVVPAGLGARDTLRLEAALPLHGNELGPGITPIEARLEWVVSLSKGDFIGRDAYLKRKESGPRFLLYGLMSQSRQPVRSHMKVFGKDGEIGWVSSGNFSPSLSKAIALIYSYQDLRFRDEVFIEARGNKLPFEVVNLPFIAKNS
jgi:aminomethyltransferase